MLRNNTDAHISSLGYLCVSIKNLYKFGWNISSDISYTKYSYDLNLGEGLCMYTSFHFPDSGLYLLNGFDFYFDLFWMAWPGAWHWKPRSREEKRGLISWTAAFCNTNRFSTRRQGVRGDGSGLTCVCLFTFWSWCQAYHRHHCHYHHHHQHLHPQQHHLHQHLWLHQHHHQHHHYQMMRRLAGMISSSWKS